MAGAIVVAPSALRQENEQNGSHRLIYDAYVS